MPNKRYATRDGEGFSALEAKKAEPVESAAEAPGEPNGLERLLTPKETADLLRRSESWLAKRRMKGDGRPSRRRDVPSAISRAVWSAG